MTAVAAPVRRLASPVRRGFVPDRPVGNQAVEIGTAGKGHRAVRFGSQQAKHMARTCFSGSGDTEERRPAHQNRVGAE